jgi:flagellar hook protein FlgE
VEGHPEKSLVADAGLPLHAVCQKAIGTAPWFWGRCQVPDRAGRHLLPCRACRAGRVGVRRIHVQASHFAPLRGGTVHAPQRPSGGVPLRQVTQENRMSILGAMSSAISGIAAQSTAFGNISDNIANSQTVGFKRVDTSFSDYLTTSTATQNEPGSVVARPDYVNNVQGTVSQTDNPLGMAITGEGLFSVSHPTGTDTTGRETFAAQNYYSRAGDFQLNKAGFLTNSAGEYLNGWIADATTGVLDKSATQPIQVSQSVYKPVATQNLTMAANLPAGTIQSVQSDATGAATRFLDSSGTAVAAIQPQVTVYDAQGAAHTVVFNWVPSFNAGAQSANVTPNTWTLSATLGGTSVSLGSATVSFATDGTLRSLTAPAAGTTAAPVASTSTTAGDPATITFDTGLAAIGGGTQLLNVNLGSIGRTGGVTQFAAADFTLRGLSQDGVPPGSFSSVTTKSTGDIYANFDNGQTRLIARVPVVTFANPDALQRQDGSSFTVTPDSGNPSLQDAGSNGAGNLSISSVEGSNVDIASEFSKLIVAQQAYSANSKVVTTADQLMQITINMKT